MHFNEYKTVKEPTKFFNWSGLKAEAETKTNAFPHSVSKDLYNDVFTYPFGIDVSVHKQKKQPQIKKRKKAETNLLPYFILLAVVLLFIIYLNHVYTLSKTANQ